MINRGFSFLRVVAGSRPSFSSTPGRKGSMRMSVVGMRLRSTEREEGDLRSRAIEDLWVVRRSEEAVGDGRSMRTTDAP